jgi:hypothetical protein
VTLARRAEVFSSFWRRVYCQFVIRIAGLAVACIGIIRLLDTGWII